MIKLFKYTRNFIMALILFVVSSQMGAPSAYAQVDNKVLEGVLNGLVTPKLVNESNKPKFSDRNQVSETIDPATGTLTLTEHDLNLPGKDGLDVNLDRQYNSSQAEVGSKRVSVTSDTSQLVGYGSGYYVTLLYWDNATSSYATKVPGYYSDYSSAYSIADYYIRNQPDSGRIYLDYDIEYKTVQYVQITYTTTTKIYPDENSYSRQRYDLGGGWSLAFPSLQMEGDYIHYHDGTGAAYVVRFDGNNQGSLENYGRNDVSMLYDSSYSNGQMNSSYVFTDEHKKKTYFGSDGRLLGMKDRFGNEVRFTHINRTLNGSTYPVISKIVDSIGRNIDFAYQSNLNDANFDTQSMTENISITVSHPSTTDKQTIVYKKGRKQVSIFENGTLIGKRYEPYLSSVTDTKGYSTYYNYYLASEAFNAQNKSLSNTAGTAVYLLQYAMYPHSTSFYEYQVVPRNWGGNGAYQAFEVTSRWDGLNIYEYDKPNPEIKARGLYNQQDYTYFGDVTGYPSYNEEESLPDSYRFGSEVTNRDGVKTKSTFNNKKQLLTTEQTAKNGETSAETVQSYDTNYKFKPTKVESKVTSGGRENKLYRNYQYSAAGDVVSETRPLTAAQQNDANQLKQYTTTYEYDPAFKLPTKTQYYNGSTLLSQITAYDSQGRIKTAQNVNGDITSYTYTTASDSRTVEVSTALENGKTARTVSVYSQSASQLFPTTIKSYYTNEAGAPVETTVQRNYNVLLGWMTSETDADNKTTQYQYDAYGRVISALHPVTNNQSGERYQVEDIWEYNDQIVDNSPNYFDADNKYLVTSRVDAYTKTTKLNNNVASYENYTHEFYDGFGNLVLQGKLDIAKNNELIVAQYHYDIMARPEYVMDMSGNVSKTSYDAWGRNNEMIDPFSNLYRNEYDLIDHKKTSYFVASTDIPAFRSNPQDSLKRNVLESTSDNWGRETMRKGFPNWPNRTTNVVQENYSYDDAGNVTAYTDPNRNTTGYAYDKLNQLTSVTNPLNQTTSYAYTKLGQLKSTTQSDGTKTWVSSKDYDETGFLKSSADPANTLDKFSRNKLGQITLRTDPNGNLINYVYDESGRNIFKQVNATLLKNVYQYSSYGPTRQEETRSGATFMTVYNDYNMYGSQTYKANVSDGVVNIVRHEFDDQNKLKNVSDPFDFFTQYGYDKTRISKVQTNGASTASSADTANAFYQYEPDGKVSSITYPKLGDGSILKTSKSYDGIGRQIKVSNTKGSTVLSDYQYGYDANGNIISITDNAGTTNYQYDKLNRLIQVRRANGQTVVYAYDVRGNRSTLKGDSNLEDSADKTYTFNAWDQLQTVTKGQQTTQFEYEMQGLRLYKSTGSTKTRYAYNNSGQVISEADATNQAVANYVWGPDRLLEKRDTASNKKYYYMYNGHGDVVQVIDENGTVVNKYQYDEWGNILQQSEQVPNSFKYAGEMQDAETGLYYLRARYYDPSAGRFISKDTYQGDVSNPLSQNLYTYVENAPLNNIDPTGNWCTSANGKYSHPGGCNDSNNWKNYSDDMSHDGQTIKNGPNFVGPPSVYNYPVEQRYARWYAGDVTAFEGASDKVKQQLAYMAKSDWTWSDAIRWFTAGAVTGAVILSPGSGLAALEVGTIGTSTYSATTLTGGTAVLFNILTRGKSVSAIPALNAVAKKALSVNRPITGIIRSDGTIEAYVQDAQFSYSHRGLGLTKADTGFNMSFYEGKWSITGSGYATSQGWRQPSVAQKEMITSMFGVK